MTPPPGGRPTFRAAPLRVRVPATSANLGPGFDAFGAALGLYDDVVAQVSDDPGVRVDVRDRLGQHPPGLARGHRRRRHRHHRDDDGRRVHAQHVVRAVVAGPRDGHAAVKAGRDVVGVPLQRGGDVEQCRVGQAVVTTDDQRACQDEARHDRRG